MTELITQFQNLYLEINMHVKTDFYHIISEINMIMVYAYYTNIICNLFILAYIPGHKGLCILCNSI